MPDTRYERKLNIAGAEDYTGMPRAAILRAAKAEPPRLRSFKAGPFGPYYFAKSDLSAWMAAMATSAEAPTDPQAVEHAAHARASK